MQALLFDMDGVLYNSEDADSGASETLAWVRRSEIPHLFVTNTTSRGRDALAAKLVRFGIAGNPNEIMTPCEAAADWLRSREAASVALFLRPAARAAFDGLHLLPDDAESGADYVVIGDLATAWDFATLNRAFRLLHANPEATLIALVSRWPRRVRQAWESQGLGSPSSYRGTLAIQQHRYGTCAATTHRLSESIPAPRTELYHAVRSVNPHAFLLATLHAFLRWLLSSCRRVQPRCCRWCADSGRNRTASQDWADSIAIRVS